MTGEPSESSLPDEVSSDLGAAASEQERFRTRAVEVAAAVCASVGPLGLFLTDGGLFPLLRWVTTGSAVVALALARAGRVDAAIWLITAAALVAAGHANATDPGSLLIGFAPAILVLFHGAVLPDRQLRVSAVGLAATVLVFRGLRWWNGVETDPSRWAGVTLDAVVLAAGTTGMVLLLRARADADATSLRRALARVERARVASERSRLEAEQAMRVARRTADERNGFLARMSHELRTPLNAILGYSELLLEDTPPGALREDLVRIKGAGDHLLGLVNDVLDLSRIEAGAMPIVRQEIAFADLVGPVVDTIRPLTRPSGNTLELAVEEGRASLDVGRTRQVLLNLLSNANKFTRAGRVRLGVRGDADAVVFTVTDTGVGIRGERLPSLFQPFVQAEPDTAQIYGGTGLGLSLCDRLVRAMGGSISVESQPGEGSVFTVILPSVGPG